MSRVTCERAQTSAKAGPVDNSWRQSRHEGPREPFVKHASPLEVPFATEQFEFLKHGLRHLPPSARSSPRTTHPPRGSGSRFHRTGGVMKSGVELFPFFASAFPAQRDEFLEGLTSTPPGRPAFPGRPVPLRSGKLTRREGASSCFPHCLTGGNGKSAPAGRPGSPGAPAAASGPAWRRSRSVGSLRR